MLTPVTGNITVYAKWTFGSGSLAGKLEWISDNAAEGGNYTHTLSAGETLHPSTLSYGGKNVTISIEGNGETLSPAAQGPLLTIDAGVTLILKDIELLGTASSGEANTSSLVMVNQGGKFIMQGDACLRENENYSEYPSTANACGGGVYVAGGGEFTMEDDASVDYNYAHADSASAYGGGVYVAGYGKFTMKGDATVFTNAALGDYNNSGVSAGSGVYVAEHGEFTMEGDATVKGNSGGVYVAGGGKFTMKDGAAVTFNPDNGVYVEANGEFTMEDNAKVNSNRSNANSPVHLNPGNGVTSCGTFIMRGSAEVSDNGGSVLSAAVAHGTDSAVEILGGTFTMEDNANVTGNRAMCGYERGGGGV
jgi:hypothetical protein